LGRCARRSSGRSSRRSVATPARGRARSRSLPHPLLVEDGGEVVLVGVEGVAAGDPPRDVLAGADRLPAPRGQVEVGEAVAGEAHQNIPSSAGGLSTTSPSTTSSSAASGSADSLTLASSWSTNSMASPSSSAVRSEGRRRNRSRNACRASFPSALSRSARAEATWGLIRPSGSSHRSSAAAIPVTLNARRRAITSAHFTAISGPYAELPPFLG